MGNEISAPMYRPTRLAKDAAKRLYDWFHPPQPDPDIFDVRNEMESDTESDYGTASEGEPDAPEPVAPVPPLKITDLPNELLSDILIWMFELNLESTYREMLKHALIVNVECVRRKLLKPALLVNKAFNANATRLLWGRIIFNPIDSTLAQKFINLVNEETKPLCGVYTTQLEIRCEVHLDWSVVAEEIAVACPNLRTIVFDNSGRHIVNHVSFRRLLLRCKNLEELTIRNCYWLAKKAMILAIPSFCPSLKKLEIRFCGYPDVELRDELAKRYPNLTLWYS